MDIRTKLNTVCSLLRKELQVCKECREVSRCPRLGNLNHAVIRVPSTKETARTARLAGEKDHGAPKMEYWVTLEIINIVQQTQLAETQR
jgi:hypothetical protein